MSDHFTCGRRFDPFTFRREENADTWRIDGTCSYCGSLNEEEFMRHLEAGDVELGPSDKNYKVYLDMPEEHPDMLRIVGHAWNVKNDPKPPGGGDWKVWDRGAMVVDGMSMHDGDWFQEQPRGPVRQAKFYFQHLRPEQQVRFIELLNEKKLKVGYPGFFYRLPFFCQKKAP